MSSKSLEPFQHFIKSYWNANHVFLKSKKVLDWQHKNNDYYNFFLAVNNSSIIGLQGYVPLSHYDSDLSSKSLFLTLLRARSNSGIGISLRLLNAIISFYNPTLIASVGINKKVHSFHKWQGFLIQQMVHSVMFSERINSFKIARVPSSFNFTSNTSLLPVKLDYKIIAQRDLSKFDLSNIFTLSYPIKSLKYVLNRYAKHPIYKYKFIVVYDSNNVLALVIIRSIKYNSSKCLKIVDYYGTKMTFSRLYYVFKDLLYKFNAEFIDIYSLGIPQIYLHRAGFFDRSSIDGLIIPNHFEPYNQKNIDIYSAIRTNLNPSKIRLFRGDGDQDRPSIID